MLTKLIKYDYKAMSKTMYPLFIAMIVITTIFSIMVKFQYDNGFIFASVSSLFVICLFGSLFITLVCVCSRFEKGLLKNEGYLSFALPVKTSTHLIAKVLNAFIWSLFEGIVLLLCMLIMGLIIGSVKEVADFIKDILALFNIMDKEMLIGIVKVVVILILELIAFISLIYSVYGIAHLFNKHQKMIQMMMIVVIFVLRLHITFWINSLYSSNNINITYYLMPIFSMIIYSLITWYILDKRLNLE